MSTKLNRIIYLIAIQIMLVVMGATGVFAADADSAQVPTQIYGRVWIDMGLGGEVNGQGAPAVNVPVFIQQVDTVADDVVMTMVVYTDGVGGFSLEGLPTGTYQIWTENDSDSVFMLLVTIDASSPVAAADLLVASHRIFLPTIMN
ncbi:MAG: hypothetical protein KF832_07190 [Caldilineaceae bacterium]|nr:hypothetical protein [Caldilineaceae bacterium]